MILNFWISPGLSIWVPRLIMSKSNASLQLSIVTSQLCLVTCLGLTKMPHGSFFVKQYCWHKKPAPVRWITRAVRHFKIRGFEVCPMVIPCIYYKGSVSLTCIIVDKVNKLFPFLYHTFYFQGWHGTNCGEKEPTGTHSYYASNQEVNGCFTEATATTQSDARQQVLLCQWLTEWLSGPL